MKRDLKFWIKETLIILALLVLLCLIAYSPIWGSDQPEEAKTEYKYILCELKVTKKGLQFVPVNGERMSYKDCRKKEKRQEAIICIADIETIIVEEIK